MEADVEALLAQSNWALKTCEFHRNFSHSALKPKSITLIWPSFFYFHAVCITFSHAMKFKFKTFLVDASSLHVFFSLFLKLKSASKLQLADGEFCVIFFKHSNEQHVRKNVFLCYDNISRFVCKYFCVELQNRSKLLSLNDFVIFE